MKRATQVAGCSSPWLSRTWVSSLSRQGGAHSLPGTEICQVTLSWRNATPLTEAISSQEKKHLDSSFTQGKQRHRGSNFPVLPVSGVGNLRKMVWTWILLHLLPVQAWDMKRNSAQRGSWYLPALCLSSLQMEITRRWLCWRINTDMKHYSFTVACASNWAHLWSKCTVLFNSLQLGWGFWHQAY